MSLGAVNVIFALITFIHAGTGMGGDFNEAAYTKAAAECAEQAKTYPQPETCEPNAETLQCGTEICGPGYYCALDDVTAAPSTCRICYGASVQENLKFGVTQISKVNQRCSPSGYTLLSINAATQKALGVYMCKEETECLSVNCQAPNGEALRLSSMACPSTNTFANDQFKKEAGGSSNMSLCVAPAIAAAVFVLIGTGAAAAAGYFAVKDTLQSEEHELYAKIGMGGAGGAAAIALFCLIANAAGMASFHDKMMPAINNYNENAAPVQGNPAPNQGDLATGIQVGGCPESCRQVKYAAASYFAAWSNYGTANIVFLVFMLILSLGMTAATICAWKLNNDGPPVGKTSSPKKVQNPMTIIGKTRPKSAATRSAPKAPSQAKPSKPPRKSTKGQLVALYSFKGAGDDELTFEEGDLIELLVDHGDGWGTGRLCDDSRQEGLFPMEYCSGAGGRV